VAEVEPEVERIFISVEDAASVLALTKWTVYGLCRDGAIESKIQGRRRLVVVESLRAYAASLPSKRESTS